MARRGTNVGRKGPLRIDTTHGWYIGNTQVTSSGAELNLLDGLTALINAANSGEEINRGRISLAASTSFSHGCAATPAAMAFSLGHDNNASVSLQKETGVPVFFRWKANGSTSVIVYGFQRDGSAATHEASVDWIAIGDQS
ncbi:MAG: hypothetical protein DRI01_01940 [Chloroflexi bacterium]|nr:MAG: hypothetical protein DRI01_01940 [Chloroflexota bacterium]